MLYLSALLLYYKRVKEIIAMAKSTSYTQQQGGSNSQTKSGSTSNTQSSTNSYSNTHTEGGSHSVTNGETWGESSSVGGSKSKGSGVSWASGEVADRTQQKFNEATKDYVRSQKVDDAYANLQNAISQRPQFQSKFEDKLNGMYETLMNRPGFTYDFNKDAMYQQYRDMYQTQGKRAMQDTMGQLAAMNSGYGSSYSQTAGQQAYQNYLQQLNDRIPELRQQALDEYDREGARLMQMYGLTSDAYEREYGQYRNDVSDWQQDRSFNQSAYQDERNFDYQQAQNDRNFWQNEYWQERNSAQSNLNESEASNWSEGRTHSLSRSETDTRSWSDSATTSHSDTNSTTNTTGWSNTAAKNWSNSSTNSTSSGSGSGSSGTVPYNQSASLGTYSEANRNAQIDQMAYFLNSSPSSRDGKVNQKELGKMIVDLKDNGTKVGKQTVTYDFQTIANLLNEADARNNKDSRNGSTYHMNNYTAKDIEKLYKEASSKNYSYWG